MSTLLNPNSFWNLVFLAGIILIILGVINGKAKIWEVFAGEVSRETQKWLRSLGAILVFVSIAFFCLSNWGGLVSPVTGGEAPKELDKHTSIQLVRAPANLAQVTVATTESKPVATITAVERHPTEAPKTFGDNVVVYVDTITLFGKSRLLICQTDVELGKAEISYDAFKAALAKGKTKILSEKPVSKNEEIDFNWNDRAYHAKIELKWFVKGKGFAVIEVYTR
jgi:hypothetical protein